MLASRTVMSLVLVAAATTAACTKSDPPTPTAASATATASTTPSATATATASAEPTPDATGAASGTATAAGTAGKPAAKDGGGTTPAASGSTGAPECGVKPLPDCPLQAWMKSNLNPPVMTNDAAALDAALTKLAGMAPPGYPNWGTIAKDGAKAAKGGDMTAAKATCRTCHDQYRPKYRAEIRARKI